MTSNRIIRTLVIFAVAMLGLGAFATACAKQTNVDRPEVKVTTSTGVETVGGKDVDATWVTTEVHMYLNADGVPTTILFCAGGFRFYSGASSTVDSGPSVGAQINRLPEQDYLCQDDSQNFPKVPR